MALYRRRSQNEHGFDSVAFMALASPHRWVYVREFLVDLNGTKDFRMDVDDSAPPCHGGCGLRPDEALMRKEGRDPFDEIADRENWDSKRRRLELWIDDLKHKVSRIHWLEEQVHETMITGTAPMNMMTQDEQKKFLHRIQMAKHRQSSYRQKRDEYRERYGW